MSDWRSKKPTEKQIQCIKDMMEFSWYSLPPFDFVNGTRGDASDYIDKWEELAHEDVNSKTFGY